MTRLRRRAAAEHRPIVAPVRRRPADRGDQGPDDALPDDRLGRAHARVPRLPARGPRPTPRWSWCPGSRTAGVPSPPAGRRRCAWRTRGCVLNGRGYHDGNHGDVPLGSDLRGWEWIRVHRPDATEITYRPWAAAPATVVRVSATAAQSQSHQLCAADSPPHPLGPARAPRPRAARRAFAARVVAVLRARRDRRRDVARAGRGRRLPSLPLALGAVDGELQDPNRERRMSWLITLWAVFAGGFTWITVYRLARAGRATQQRRQPGAPPPPRAAAAPRRRADAARAREPGCAHRLLRAALARGALAVPAAAHLGQRALAPVRSAHQQPQGGSPRLRAGRRFRSSATRWCSASTPT